MNSMFSAVWASGASLLDQASFQLPHASVILRLPWLVLSPLLVDTDHCRLKAAVLKILWASLDPCLSVSLLFLDLLFLFQSSDTSLLKKMFTCCLMYPTYWQVSLSKDDVTHLTCQWSLHWGWSVYALVKYLWDKLFYEWIKFRLQAVSVYIMLSSFHFVINCAASAHKIWLIYFWGAAQLIKSAISDSPGPPSSRLKLAPFSPNSTGKSQPIYDLRMSYSAARSADSHDAEYELSMQLNECFLKVTVRIPRLRSCSNLQEGEREKEWKRLHSFHE